MGFEHGRDLAETKGIGMQINILHTYSPRSIIELDKCSHLFAANHGRGSGSQERNYIESADTRIKYIFSDKTVFPVLKAYFPKKMV